MTAKGLVPAPPNCKWELRETVFPGHDFYLSLEHSWSGRDATEPLAFGFVPREADLHRISKRLVRKYQREQARKARINQVLDAFNEGKAA